MLRQTHALEHATVWVLDEMHPAPHSKVTGRYTDNGAIGGLSTDRGFYLYGAIPRTLLRQAAQTALQRLQSGEWELALHPRCGTNLSVAMMLMAGLTVGSSWLASRGFLEQLVVLGLASATTAQLAPDLGLWAQRYLTTAIPFNLTIEKVFPTRDLWGRSAYFVQVAWQDRA